MPKERARRLSLVGAAFFFVLLIFVPIVGPEHNGARRWIEFGLGQVQPSEFLKPFYVVSLAWLLSLKDADKSLPVYPISAVLVMLSGPGNALFLLVVSLPAAILIVAASFLCFGLGTAAAFTRSRWPQMRS